MNVKLLIAGALTCICGVVSHQTAQARITIIAVGAVLVVAALAAAMFTMLTAPAVVRVRDPRSGRIKRGGLGQQHRDDVDLLEELRNRT